MLKNLFQLCCNQPNKNCNELPGKVHSTIHVYREKFGFDKLGKVGVARI